MSVITQDHRRGHLRTVDDAQATATRAGLVDAYRAAAAEQIRRPSVLWLCERSGTARSTFYTHFRSVEDLAAFAVTEHFDEVSADDLRDRAARDEDGGAIATRGLRAVVESVHRSRDLLAYATAQGSRAAVVESLVDRVALYTRRSVEAEYTSADPIQVDLVTRFVSGGLVEALFAWLDDPDVADVDQVTRIVTAALPERLRS